MIEDEADVLWPADSAVWHVDLLAIAMVVRDGAVKAHEVTWDGNREAVHGQVDLIVTRFRAGRGVGVGAKDSGGDGTGGFVFVVDAGCEGKVQARDERRRGGRDRGSRSGVCAGVFGGGHCDASDGGGGCGHWGVGYKFHSIYGARVLPTEVFYQLFSIDMAEGFPAVMCFREPFPSNQILQLVTPPSCAQNLLHFPFRLAVDKVRGWFLKVGTVGCGFVVRGEKGSVEYIVNLPLRGKLQTERRAGYCCRDEKRAISFWSQFGRWVGGVQVFGV
jgi:hypothetical protein